MPPHESSARGLAAPSGWVTRFAHLIRAGGSVLDVACGSGRHSRWLLERGYKVLAVDRDLSALNLAHPALEALSADLEAGPWPLGARTFDALLVTNYLWRPLWPALLAALEPGGVLLYETFARGNEALGPPRNPEFLLEPGELIERVHAELQIVAYEEGRLGEAKPRVIQRICALGKTRSVTECMLA